MRLWYEEPAKVWHEALPIGNGSLGGMVYGHPVHEIIQLNEESIWSGGRINRRNPDALLNFPKIRKLLRKGKISEAEQLALYALSGTPNSQRAYQTAGELYLNFYHVEPVSKYLRELDLEKGIVRVTYETDETRYSREIFASFPDGVIVLHLTAEGKERINFDCRLDRCHNRTDEVSRDGGNSIQFKVCSQGGISFCVRLTSSECDGNIRIIGEHMIVEQASEITLLLSIATSYRYEKFEEACKLRIQKVIHKAGEELRKSHLEDFQKLFGRVALSFKVPESRKIGEMPTDKRLEAVKRGEIDPNLFVLYFQYGRYLLLSSSREGSLPANLQGLWNESLNPPWDSKYTININTQMNYWIAESGNLSECHLPYFVHLRKVMEDGKKTAREMYGCRGSVAHHNTDIYGDTAPQDHCVPATYWVMGEAWLATHIWEHYQYTQDVEFLEANYDLLEECVLFFYDFLIEGPEGKLVTSPSVSPENAYITKDGTRGCLCEGSTMDNEVLRELFRGYIGASRVLNKSPEKVEKAENTVRRLPDFKIGRYGQLQEWLEDYEEVEPGHRHISHLYGVYPGTTFTWQDTPELMQAARCALERRLAYGGGHTGWSRAWIIGLWARFGDGEKAFENLQALLSLGTFPNLMDNHPMGEGFVFQIDGNLGASAAMVEMLVQSHNGRIILLPALPAALDTGSVSGICLRGGSELSMKWERGKVTELEIYSGYNQMVCLVANGVESQLKLEAGSIYHHKWSEGEPV